MPDGGVLETPAIVTPGLLGMPLPGGNLPGAPTPQFITAQNSGIGYSADLGASWSLIRANGKLCPQGDNDLYVDHDTGHLYYSCIFAPLPGPADAYSSYYAPRAELITSRPDVDASGRYRYTTWNENTATGFTSENPRFTTAPAPVGYTPPIAGEKVAYWCGNTINAAIGRACLRSFDGGESWQWASLLYTGPVSTQPECNSQGASGGYPQGDNTDGSLLVLLNCNGHGYILKSVDEASTWSVPKRSDGSLVEVPKGSAPTELRVDHAGNLYLGQQSGNNLLLWTSTDKGDTWAGPYDMTPPEARATTINKWGFAIGWQPGVVAVSYLLAHNGGGYDGHVTVTHDAVIRTSIGRWGANDPTFYAAQLNDPNGPALIVTQHLNDDFITLDVAKDGTPWAAYYSECRKGPNGHYTDPYCEQTQNTYIIPFVPPVAQGTHSMTVGSLRFG